VERLEEGGQVGVRMKTEATLGGVPLAATQAIQWRLTTGTAPYVTTMSVHRSQWDAIRHQMGRPLQLKITDSRGKSVTIERVYVLHEAPSDSPHRASFVVADCRWLWPYKLIALDVNVTKRTGNVFAPGGQGPVPIEMVVTADEYQFREYSLVDGKKRWTAEELLREILHTLENQSFRILSLPIRNDDTQGKFSLQNILLRDPGHVALSQVLGYIPGAQVFVSPAGEVCVFDGTALRETGQRVNSQEIRTWDGDHPVLVRKNKIRPTRIDVYYQREVEVLVRFDDDYSGQTSARPGKNTPFAENVIPTVDPTTQVKVFLPERGEEVETTVRQGTWIEAGDWLKAMDDDRPEESLPWTFRTLRHYWLEGGLEGCLGNVGRSTPQQEISSNPELRVAALRKHFRQTFRLNQRYVQRVRSLQATRVRLLDPATGLRARSLVWAKACMLTDDRFQISRKRDTDGMRFLSINLDFLPLLGARTINSPAAPSAVTMLDEDVGIFRIDWLESPYGLSKGFIPCNLVDENEQLSGISDNIERQIDVPIMMGGKIREGANGLLLANKTTVLAMLTMVPAAPNNKRQFHKVSVRSEDIDDVFRDSFSLQGGSGPPLEIFVDPSEATARWAWDDDAVARFTAARLLGLEMVDENGQAYDEPGIEGPLPGYILVNEEEIKAHSRAVAAEAIAGFADTWTGTVATSLDSADQDLVGNMASTTISVSAAPSSRVIVLHEYSLEPHAVSRFAMLPNSVRHVLLGVLPYGAP
jgi:hypothetical protein